MVAMTAVGSVAHCKFKTQTIATTYDPAILSAWGTVGTQGDVGKAQELYAKAFASGVREAKDRLTVLHY
jgi:hypothetical protein